MCAPFDPPPALAPLQRVMLRDSLSCGGAGYHVEQLEIRFARGVADGRVVAAWEETVAKTEALRIAFLTRDGIACGREFVDSTQSLILEEFVPESWESWLEADRLRPLIAPRAVPWRAVYWPSARRFIWTFHHALLDGRSISRIMRGFLDRVRGGEAEALAIAEWREPSPESVALADRMFREDYAKPEDFRLSPGSQEQGQAVRCLGMDCAARLESLAAELDVTAATVLTWAWGQALAGASGAAVVVVEQLRAGEPQPGTAGFTMNTLPVTIHRAADGEAEQSLREFRKYLLALRVIERVCPENFPPGVFPDLDGPVTSVIMIEHGTLRHLAGGEAVESVVLHECKGETLMAAAHVLPDLRLEVEGPGRQLLLEEWIGVLDRLSGGWRIRAE